MGGSLCYSVCIRLSEVGGLLYVICIRVDGRFTVRYSYASELSRCGTLHYTSELSWTFIVVGMQVSCMSGRFAVIGELIGGLFLLVRKLSGRFVIIGK